MNCDYLFSGILNFSQYLVLYILILAIIVIHFWVINKDRVGKWFVLFIVFGALYNFYFRISQRCVPDPFNFFGLFKFNIADILIDIGVLTLAIYTLIKDPLPKNE